MIAQKQQRRTVGEAFEYMMNGATFIKYGKKGIPKPRHVFLFDKFICCRDPKDMGQPDVKAKRKKRMIALKEIREVVLGRTTKPFEKYKNGKDHLSFSLQGYTRSLDLEAPSDIERRIFVEYLQVVIESSQTDQKDQGKVEVDVAQQTDNNNNHYKV